MPEQLTNRQCAERLQQHPGRNQLVVFQYAPIDIDRVPDDALVVPLHIVPMDWRHVADCFVVIAHDGINTGRPLQAVDHCARFAPRELLAWRVPDDAWVCVSDAAGKVIKPCPGLW